MKIYHYSSDNFEYLQESEARKSPLEPDVYLEPANSTKVPPPECGQNEVAVFNGVRWQIFPDFRGDWFDQSREKVTISQLGPLPNGYVKDLPPLTGEQLKAISEVEVRTRYAAMLLAITEPYGKEERETWKTQEEEASQWVSDNTSPCTMIRGMAAARGIAIELMVAKIQKNATLFREASGQILGMQQAEIDLLYPEKKEEV